MLAQTIPSYAYIQYNDDPDIAAFITAFNQTAQQYVDFFNQIGLPIYTGPMITGSLLDWVAEGIYGMTRPSLPGAGNDVVTGPFNTVAFNTQPFNSRKVVAPMNYYATTDDIFKRIITWNFFKGDGQVFNIRWLKRRVMRFLTGPNGVDPGVNQTYQISVTFGVGNQVFINLKSHAATLQNGSLFNKGAFNTNTFNGFDVVTNPLPPLPDGEILAAAIEAGVVNLPFQYQFFVNVE